MNYQNFNKLISLVALFLFLGSCVAIDRDFNNSSSSVSKKSGILKNKCLNTNQPTKNAKSFVSGTLSTGAIATGHRRVFAFDSAGIVIWQAQAPGNVHDVSILRNGNVLIAAGGFAREISPTGKVIWEYRPENQAGGGVFSVQRLKNGNTVVGENSTGKILEFNSAGKVIRTIQTSWNTKNKHHQMRLVRKTASGKFLCCTSGDKLFRVFDQNGRICLSITGKNICFKAIELKSGNYLVSWLDEIIEYDQVGKKVWSFSRQDIKDQHISMMTGIDELESGNIVVGTYSSYNKNRKGIAAFEITKDKKIVWSYSKPGSDKSLMTVQKLSPSQLEILSKTECNIPRK